MSVVWDAVVVGAGPAGCAAAYDLRSRERRVLLLDRARFPRPKACAGGLTMKAVRALRYPVDPVVRRWCNGLVLDGGSGRKAHLQRRAPVCAMTVREEFDAFCLEKTLEHGVDFERVRTLRHLSQNGDTATLCFDDGRSVRARYVVGADGVHSAVRGMAAARSWFRQGFAIETNVSYDTSKEELPPFTFDFMPVGRGYGWLFPRDNHVNIGLYVDGDQEKIGRAALERYIERHCGTGREQSRIVGQFLGLGAAAYIPESGTRVLLAGDAAGFVDPLTGEGISGAIRSGQAAAAAIETALRAGLDVGQCYRREMRGLQGDLHIAEYAAERFYGNQARGWQLLEAPLLPRLALRAYSDGLSLRGLLRAARVISRVQLLFNRVADGAQ